MPLDLSPLANAIGRLDEGLRRYRADTSDGQIRDGLIQRFEFTYDLTHKMIRRVMEAGAANPEAIDRMSFPDLIRTADELGLVGSDWSKWRQWRDMRNITSHTYDEAKALMVVEGIPDFLAEARDVANRLQADRER
jgi:nucleotidyltransferase substrate binding protein (TIGR01987 family)